MYYSPRKAGPTSKQNTWYIYIDFITAMGATPKRSPKEVCAKLKISLGDYYSFDVRRDALLAKVEKAILDARGALDHVPRAITVTKFDKAVFAQFEQRSYYGKMYAEEICRLLGLSLGDFFLYKELLARKQAQQNSLEEDDTFDDDCSDEGELYNEDY